MKIRKLSILRMPGFEQKGFDLPELSEGLNVVIGPNASGKTTACRAIRGLLWPETLAGASPISLVGDWADGEQALRLELEGTRLTCQREGVPAEMPPVPGPHLATCFTITIDDLFQGAQTDTDLAARISREMSGGYDLSAVRRSDMLDLSRRHGKKELEQLKQAKQAVNAIRADHEALLREENELERLQQKSQAALGAQARLALLDNARELADVRGQAAQAQANLDAFPAGMDLLRGNELDSLQQIRADLAESTAQLERALASAELATQQKRDAGLPAEGIPEVRIDEHTAHRAAFRDVQRDLRDAEKRLGDADNIVAAALAALGDDLGPAEADAIDLAGLNDIEAFHRDVEDLQSRRTAIEGRLASVGKLEPSSDVDSLINGVNILRQWIEAGAGESGTSRRNLMLTLVPTALLAIVGISLAIFVSPWWALILLPAAVGAVLALLPAGKGNVASRSREMLNAQFCRLPLDAPAAWDAESVGLHLNGLERSLAQARQAEAHKVQREDCERQLAELNERAERIAARRDELVARLGVATDTSTLALVVLAGNLQAYREAKTTREKCRGETAALQESRDEILLIVNAFLAEFGAEPCQTHDIAEARGKAIEKRAKLHRDAKGLLADAERSTTGARKRIGILQDRKRTLFTAVGLEDDDDAIIEERLRLLQGHNDAMKRRGDLEATAKGLTARLQDTPELLEMTAGEIDGHATGLTTVAESYEGLVEKIADIRLRVDNARRDTCMEVALGEVEWATVVLTQRRDEAELAAAGGFLLDEVEREHKVESQPEVFRQAARLFTMFTRGRYELRLGELSDTGESAFRALDTTNQRGLALGELSRGTYMQLLLAVRLAFAAAAERGTQLPFVLDEVLSSTDPMRFRAIIECLLALVKDGRQIFYFTCQPSDAAAWQEVADQMGAMGARRIDLADVQRLERTASSLLSESSARQKPIPEPRDMSLGEYAELLGVPQRDPTVGAGAAHLAHLIEDSGQLHRLLAAGIETYGQLQSLTACGDVDAFAPADLLARIQARACVLDAFAEAWRIGRGCPVSPEVLAESGVSERFIERVTNLARELDWDARRLVDALGARQDDRAKGFRSDALDQVKESLMESGHLDTRATLNEQELLARVLAAAHDHVRRGAIEGAEVRELFHRLLQLCPKRD